MLMRVPFLLGEYQGTNLSADRRKLSKV